jgi:hypothetical protein
VEVSSRVRLQSGESVGSGEMKSTEKMAGEEGLSTELPDFV